MRTRLVLSLVACVTTLLVASSNATVIPVLPAGDGYWHNESGSSYDYFETGADPNPAAYMFWGTSDTLQHNTSYAQFDLSAIPDGSTVASATLNIYMLAAWLTGSTPDCGNIKHAANSSGANGNASQKIGGSDVVGTIDPQTDPAWLTFVITSELQSDLDLGYAWSCFSFNANTSGDYSNRNAGFNFASAEGGSNVAYLDVTMVPVPEPATFALLSLGATLAVRRRRRS